MFPFSGYPPISALDSWRQILFAAIGGLTEIGFSDDETFLLAVSHDGRGLFNLVASKRIARDDEQPGLDSPWIDAARKSIRGIGPAEDTWFPVVGLWGGALPQDTRSGWVTEIAAKGRHELALLGTGRKRWLVARPVSEIKAFGFSPSGRYLVLATSSDIALFRHADPHHA